MRTRSAPQLRREASLEDAGGAVAVGTGLGGKGGGVLVGEGVPAVDAQVAGGLVLASAFPAGQDHPAKAAVDEALRAFGYRPPRSYAQLKEDGEAAVAAPGALAGLAAGAGLADVTVTRRRIDVGLLDSGALVAWRLGMASSAPLRPGSGRPSRRRSHRRTARARPAPPPLVLDQLVLHARV